MVLKLLEIDANVDLLNESNRTPYAEAEEFDKFEIAVIIRLFRKSLHL
jgi:hypothetical protein